MARAHNNNLSHHGLGQQQQEQSNRKRMKAESEMKTRKPSDSGWHTKQAQTSRIDRLTVLLFFATLPFLDAR